MPEKVTRREVILWEVVLREVIPWEVILWEVTLWEGSRKRESYQTLSNMRLLSGRLTQSVALNKSPNNRTTPNTKHHCKSKSVGPV